VTDDELNLIETELQIRLPDDYRALMRAFPIPACAGNHDWALWDNAEYLIAENRQLRDGCPATGGQRWPSRFFCLGRQEGDMSVYAIDLEDRNAAVWWMDHGNVDAATGGVAATPFRDWAAEYLDAMRDDLVGDEIDPDASPAERQKIEQASARAVLKFLAIWCIACVVAVLAYFLFLLRRH
jgi:hypothetical protein